jgi:hypothetical protein
VIHSVDLPHRGVELGQPPVTAAGRHPGVQAVEQRLEERPLLPQFVACGGPRRDVVQEGVEDRLTPLVLKLQRHLHRELPAIAINRGQLQPASGELGVTGTADPRHTGIVGVTQRRRNHQLGGGASDRLVGGPSEEPLGRPVPGRDPAAAVHRHERVVGAVQHRTPARRGTERLVALVSQRRLRCGDQVVVSRHHRNRSATGRRH